MRGTRGDSRRIGCADPAEASPPALLINVPRLLEDIVADLYRDGGVERLNSNRPAAVLLSSARARGRRLVVVRAERGELAELREAVEDLMRLRVVVVIDEGATGLVYKLLPTPVEIGPVNREHLEQAIEPGGSS
jgi:hypothetical protein